MRRTSPFLVACAAVLVLVAAVALGSRNSSGTYSLPSGNPVVTGTTITSSWANSTLGDIATELTDSLDRYGRGAMLAPLKSTDGTLASPGLTFSSEQTSGLYRAGSGDVRLSVLDTEAQQWTSAASEISLPLTCDDGVTITTTVADGDGLATTGNGSGAGVVATGGADGGVGVSGVGAGGDANGVNGVGAGAGFGVHGKGGADGGAGVEGVGGLNGDGVVGIGSGSGYGGDFEGGAIALHAIAIGSGGIGVVGIGHSGGEGGHFTAGTTATGSSPQNAVVLQGGYLSLDGVADPNNDTAITNTLTPLNIPKAWARIGCSSGSCSISDGFDVSSVATTSTSIVLTLASSVGASSAAVASTAGGTYSQAVASASGNLVTMAVYTPTGTQGVPNDGSFGTTLNVVVFGAQ